MKDNNLPDSCQGSDPSYPWNQEDDYMCPECGDSTEVVNGTLICLNDDCDHIEEPDDCEGGY